MRNLFLVSLLLLATVACTERRQQGLVREAEEKSTQGNYAEAAELLKKAVSLNPESRAATKALYKLGFTQESYLRDFEAAVFNYQEFMRQSHDQVALYEVQKRIANVYFEQFRDSEKAIASYKRLLQFSPDSLEGDFFQFRIAQSYFRQNSFDQARVEYQNLLERYPKSQYVARARFEIGNSYYMEGKYEIGLEALKQVTRLHPQSGFSVEAGYLIAQCLEQLERLPSALQEYEAILSTYPHPKVIELRIEGLKKRIKQKK